MARPPKFNDPTKLNLYVERSTAKNARLLASIEERSISDIVSDFVNQHPKVVGYHKRMEQKKKNP